MNQFEPRVSTYRLGLAEASNRLQALEGVNARPIRSTLVHNLALQLFKNAALAVVGCLYHENWNFQVQQGLSYGFVGQVGYVGSEGHKLFSSRPVNLINPLTGKRPLPEFGRFNVKENDANSSFHALQGSLLRAYANGFLWQTQYMWSHSIIDGSVGAGESVSFQDPNCRACDRSDSPYDVRQTSTSNFIYDLPIGPGRGYLQSGILGHVIGGWR